jgi:hypothetical protein
VGTTLSDSGMGSTWVGGSGVATRGSGVGSEVGADSSGVGSTSTIEIRSANTAVLILVANNAWVLAGTSASLEAKAEHN